MKLLILLLNIFSISFMDPDIEIEGSFFPSHKYQKFFKYYFTESRFRTIEPLKDIPIAPTTSISIIYLDTTLLHEKQLEFFKIKEGVSKICSKINWERNAHQWNSIPDMKSELSNKLKLGILFTAGSHLELNGSNWTRFMDHFYHGRADLDKLKEQLDIYFPKISIKAYDIEVSNCDYKYGYYGKISKASEDSNGEISNSSEMAQNTVFRGALIFEVKIPYSQKFFEEMKSGLVAALESIKNRPNQEAGIINKATELEVIIRDENFKRTSFFELGAQRPIEIEKTSDSSGKVSYKTKFEELDAIRYRQVKNKRLNFYFLNTLVLQEKGDTKYHGYVTFECIGLRRQHDVEEVNSLLDEYFEIPKPNTTISRPDTTKSSNGKGTLVVLLALFLCLGIALFAWGYYYKKKRNYFSNRVYKNRKEGKC